MSGNRDFIKPLVGGAVAAGLDNMYLNNKNQTANMYFGAAVAVGLYASQVIEPIMPQIIPASLLSNGKTIEDRIIEIGAGAGSSYVLNKYILKNDFNQSEMIKKLGVIVASDFIGEYASDYMAGRALSYF
jgi:hypothetical protein